MTGHPRSKLTAATVKRARPGYHADGNGLYLVVDGTGARRWALRTLVFGRRREIGLGSAGLVSLAEARETARRLRKVAREGGEGTCELMDEFRRQAREWEGKTDGLLLSFIGKLPGLAARLSLVLAYLDWAAGEAEAPREITRNHFGRAAHFIEAYALPMARRAYADASVLKEERAALRLVAVIRERVAALHNT